MPQTQPSPKPINNNSSIAFANDNFCGINHPPLEGGSNGKAVWGGVNFLSASQAFNSNASQAFNQNASQAFNSKALLNKPHSFLNPSPAFNNFKNSPSLAQNASSLLFASLQDDSRQPLRRSLRSLLNPFWLKTLFAFF